MVAISCLHAAIFFSVVHAGCDTGLVAATQMREKMNAWVLKNIMAAGDWKD